MVAFLDADDVWFPDKLQKQTEALDRFPDAAMVLGPARVWYSWAGPSSSGSDYDYVPKYAGDALVAPPEILRTMLLGEADAPYPSGMLIRTVVALDVRGFEADVPGLCDDRGLNGAKDPRRHPLLVSQSEREGPSVRSPALESRNWFQRD